MQSLRVLSRMFTWPVVLATLLAMAALACGPFGSPYEETFDSEGSWAVGNNAGAAQGSVNNGQYELLVESDFGLFWTTAGESFEDGVYELDATQLDGPLDNGYGMIFRTNTDTDDFYLFEVSGDGYVEIVRCTNGCQEELVHLVSDDWIESPAVQTGLNKTNKLRVRAEGPNLIFYVNGQEVGRVTDNTFTKGDIGVLVETLGQGGVKVGFDNFTVTPLDETN